MRFSSASDKHFVRTQSDSSNFRDNATRKTHLFPTAPSSSIPRFIPRIALSTNTEYIDVVIITRNGGKRRNEGSSERLPLGPLVSIKPYMATGAICSRCKHINSIFPTAYDDRFSEYFSAQRLPCTPRVSIPPPMNDSGGVASSKYVESVWGP